MLVVIVVIIVLRVRYGINILVPVTVIAGGAGCAAISQAPGSPTARARLS
jgi:hypothetical protein